VAFRRVRYGAPPPAVRVAEAAEAFAEAGWVESGRAAVSVDEYAVRFAPGKVPAKRAAPVMAWRRGDAPVPDFDPALAEEFRSDPAAWEWFERQPPRYRRAATWWVSSAKSEATVRRRFDALVEASAAGHQLEALRRQL
jgi:hypothetical protein